MTKEQKVLKIERTISKLAILPLYVVANAALFLSIWKDETITASSLGLEDLSRAIIVVIVSFLWKRYSDYIFKGARIANAISTLSDLIMVVLFFKGVIPPLAFLIYSSTCLMAMCLIVDNSYIRIKLIVFKEKELENFENFVLIISNISAIMSSIILIIFNVQKDVAVWLFLIATCLDSILIHVFLTYFKDAKYASRNSTI